jgi:septum formation protein
VLVLASASPRRRELLARLCSEFVVAPVDVDETPPEGVSPAAAACEVARRKALASARCAEGPVIAADTMVVAADGEILGKPRDAADARRMLRKLSGTTHRVVTGVALVASRGMLPVVGSESTAVTMRVLADGEIDAYVATGEPFGKAGSYAIQETGDRFVTRVDGSFTNVVGLPVETVGRLLAAAGIATKGRT